LTGETSRSDRGVSRLRLSKLSARKYNCLNKEIIMSISKDEYSKMTDKASPNSPIIKNCIKAFLFGGAICAFGQGLWFIFEALGMARTNTRRQRCAR
jgi:hypothetical protein